MLSVIHCTYRLIHHGFVNKLKINEFVGFDLFYLLSYNIIFLKDTFNIPEFMKMEHLEMKIANCVKLKRKRGMFFI